MFARRSTCRRLIQSGMMVLALPVIVPVRAAEIRHRMLIGDESRAQLLYVDRQDPSKDWTLKLPARYRDVQLVGNVVVSNWTGHGPGDSSKGVQLIEFTPEGRLVWKWHDPQRAGTAHAIIVLDDLDTSVLNDDVSGVLGPMK